MASGSVTRDLTKGRRERRRRRWPEETPQDARAIRSASVSSRSAPSARTWNSYICRPVENVSVFAFFSLENVPVNAFLTIFWLSEIYRQTWNTIFTWFLSAQIQQPVDEVDIRSQRYFCSRNSPPGAMASQVRDNRERRSVVKDCRQFQCRGKTKL